MGYLALVGNFERDFGDPQVPREKTVSILCVLRSIEGELERERLRRASDPRTALNAITGQLRVTGSLLDACNALWPEIKPRSSVSVRRAPRNPPV